MGLKLELSLELINKFMPMNLILDADLTIQSIGPTLKKIVDDTQILGLRFDEVFDVRRPQDFDLLDVGNCEEDGKVKVNLRSGKAKRMSGFVQPLPNGQGFLANFSLGAGVVTAKDNVGLVSNDFAPTDPSIDMLYMIEVQSALLDEARKVTLRMNNDRSRAVQNAGTDTLTGLANRRGLNAFVKRILSRPKMVPYALVMIDLDYFKKVNDDLGHAAGDFVLMDVAQKIKNLTRPTDMAARTGGDEFMLILPDFEDSETALQLSQRLIKEIEKPINYNGIGCKISASIGVNVILERSDWDQIVHRTDAALYSSKAKGRGRVTLVG